MSKLLSTFIIFAILLCGCSAKGGNNTEESTKSETITSQINIKSDIKYTIQSELRKNGSIFNFDIKEIETGFEFHMYKYIVEISCDESDYYEPHSIEIESTILWESENLKKYFDLVDIDFDGFADIQTVIGEGVSNISYAFYRWDIFESKFEEESFFELLTPQYKLFSDTKQIISGYRSSVVDFYYSMYQLGNTKNGNWFGEYELIRRETQEYVSNKENDRVSHVFIGDEEIYKWNWTEGNNQDIVENYMRFGISNPISVEEAKALLYEEYGESDTKSGFKFSFQFKEMVMYEKLSCYAFSLSWLVDDDHWSSVDTVAITPDGKQIFSV